MVTETRKIQRYGWHPSLPHHEDKFHEAPMMATLPTHVDLRPECPPVYNQGAIGSCTANALAGCLQFDEMKQHKTDTGIPSRLFIYYNERYLEGTVNFDAGASMRDGLNACARWGFCDEIYWPYNIGSFTTAPPATAYSAAIKERITQYARIYQTSDQTKGCLAAGLPFCFGFTVYQSFESPTTASTGILPMPKPGELIIGGHAVVAVGYDDVSQMFIIRNSWGAGWGQHGYFMMPYTYLLNPNLAADFWVVSAIP